MTPPLQKHSSQKAPPHLPPQANSQVRSRAPRSPASQCGTAASGPHRGAPTPPWRSAWPPPQRPPGSRMRRQRGQVANRWALRRPQMLAPLVSCSPHSPTGHCFQTNPAPGPSATLQDRSQPVGWAGPCQAAAVTSLRAHPNPPTNTGRGDAG